MSAQPSFFGESPSAHISACKRYRYSLTRRWAPGPWAVWVMLNPSTADASSDDATITSCIARSKMWHCGGLEVVNLFAYRATDPAELLKVDDPVGNPEANRAIVAAVEDRKPIVVAWGNVHKALRWRVNDVLELLGGLPLRTIGLTQGSDPKHPLARGKARVPYDAPLQVFDPRGQ